MPNANTLLRTLATVTAAATCASAVAAQTALNPEERRIVAYADAHAEDAIGLLERAVNVNSGTMNPEGVRAVGRIFRAELDGIGFRTRWVDPAPGMERAGHLFAEHPGTRGRRVLLIGHLDTVFERDHPFQRFARSGTTATGPGVNDMKGGDVVIVYALKALHAAGVLDGAGVIVAMTGDEENAGRPLEVARRDLVEAARRSDVALEFETGSRDERGDYAVIARRGTSSWTLRVHARPGHASGIFQPASGSGAIFEAARILNAFHQGLRGEPNLTFNPGMIVGGSDVRLEHEGTRGTASGKDNVIADTAVVTGDLRTLSPEQLNGVRERMKAIVARSHPHATAEITFAEGYPGMPPTRGNQALLDLLNGVNRGLGLAPQLAFDPGRRGAADVSFVAPYVDALAGLGTHGTGSHSDRENVDLATLPTQIKRAALLIYRLTR